MVFWFLLTVTAAEFHRHLLLMPDPQIKPPHHPIPTGRPNQTPTLSTTTTTTTVVVVVVIVILRASLQTRHAFVHRVRDVGRFNNIYIAEGPGVEEAEGVVGGDGGEVSGGVVVGSKVYGDDFVDVGGLILGGKVGEGGGGGGCAG